MQLDGIDSRICGVGGLAIEKNVMYIFKMQIYWEVDWQSVERKNFSAVEVTDNLLVYAMII